MACMLVRQGLVNNGVSKQQHFTHSMFIRGHFHHEQKQKTQLVIILAQCKNSHTLEQLLYRLPVSVFLVRVCVCVCVCVSEDVARSCGMQRAAPGGLAASLASSRGVRSESACQRRRRLTGRRPIRAEELSASQQRRWRRSRSKAPVVWGLSPWLQRPQSQVNQTGGNAAKLL